MKGPAVEDLRIHFLTRWDWIYSQLNPRSIRSRYKTLFNAPKVPEVTATDDISKPSATLQILRSYSQWSHGISTEVLFLCFSCHGKPLLIVSQHSIQNAYIDVIYKSEHFIYIENQFFITAIGSEQSPIQNRVGVAIVERVLRAYKTG